MTSTNPPEKEEGAMRSSATEDDQLRSPASETYAEGEKVLAFHGALLYEAKVQKIEFRKDDRKYFVHYLGWNKNWDEWVPSDRLVKFNEENVRKQQALEKNQVGEKNVKSGRSAQNKPKNSDVKLDKEDQKIYASKGKKRKSQPEIEEKDKTSTESILMLNLPMTLRQQLLEDWENVTKLGKLVKLPRSPNVDEILKRYLEYRVQKDGRISDSVAEILNGLRSYFDKALPAMLLYAKERKQYTEVAQPTVSSASIYGAEHLLRLFVKLPELLAHVNMEEDALSKLQLKLADFLKFLQKNQSSFFLASYDEFKSAAEGDDETH